MKGPKIRIVFHQDEKAQNAIMNAINIKQKNGKKEKTHTCVNLYRVTNEYTPENQVEWVNKNRKIYNSTFTFKEDALIEKNG